jgi:hypothetical protein
MKLTEHQMWLLGVGILLAAYLTLRNGVFSTGAKQWQPEGTVMGMTDYRDLGECVCEPEHHTGPVVYLPCRYPVRSGENITTLIDKGFDPLFQSKPADQAWMVQPPSEVGL